MVQTRLATAGVYNYNDKDSKDSKCFCSIVAKRNNLFRKILNIIVYIATIQIYDKGIIIYIFYSHVTIIFIPNFLITSIIIIFFITPIIIIFIIITGVIIVSIAIITLTNTISKVYCYTTFTIFSHYLFHYIL